MKSKKKTLIPGLFAFDIDGVVADTMGTFISIARKDYGIKDIRKEQITDYWIEQCLPVPEKIVWEIVERIVEDPFGVGLRPITGAKEALLAFARYATPLTFVTARPKKSSIEMWLQELLNELPKEHIRVIATGEHAKKVEVLKDEGYRYFVEDNIETCLQLYEVGINAIVFDQPWNRSSTPFKRVRSWRELLELTGLD